MRQVFEHACKSSMRPPIYCLIMSVSILNLLVFSVLANARLIAVSLHAGELQFNLTRANSALNVVKDLGAGGIRTDIFWQDIETIAGSGQWNELKIAFYETFLQLVQAQ